MIARRLLAVPVTAIFAGAAAASATLAWFDEGGLFSVPEDAPGYDTAGGSALLLIASLGAGFAIVAGLLGGRRLWLGEVALALAGLGAVTAEGAFHEPGGDRTEWHATNWYWAAIVVTGAWLVVAAIAGVLIHSGHACVHSRFRVRGGFGRRRRRPVGNRSPGIAVGP